MKTAIQAYNQKDIPRLREERDQYYKEAIEIQEQIKSILPSQRVDAILRGEIALDNHNKCVYLIEQIKKDTNNIF